MGMKKKYSQIAHYKIEDQIYLHQIEFCFAVWMNEYGHLQNTTDGCGDDVLNLLAINEQDICTDITINYMYVCMIDDIRNDIMI